MTTATPWSRFECEAIVSDYFEMLDRDLRSQTYSKAAHRRALMQRLDGRGEGSIEYKHQNISAVLLRAGHAYIPGYKPAWNYQSLLEKVVLERIGAQPESLFVAEDELIESPASVAEPNDWASLFVDPPEREVVHKVQDRGTPKPRRVDYSEREARNRKLGERGEAFVLQIEKARLETLGRSDLAGDVEWTSKTLGDGTGYDIRSFAGTTDEELFIEVKTTNNGMYMPFLISVNELRFSKARSDQYALYRLFEFRKRPGIYRLDGAIDQHVHLDATVFRASFRN